MLPCALKYASGSLYVGSENAVYKVSQQTGGGDSASPPGCSPFDQACGVAVDGAGNVLVADDDEVVAVAAKTGTFYGKKMIKGHVYLIAAGFQADTGAMDVQLDPSGNVVFAVAGEEASHTDYEQDSQIFVLAERAGTFYGKKMTKGKLYVIAGVLNGGGSPTPCDAPDAADAGRSHQGDPGQPRLHDRHAPLRRRGEHHPRRQRRRQRLPVRRGDVRRAHRGSR